MVDQLDLSQVPRGELSASRLVTAVAQIGDLAERHYLEIKGPLDLSTKLAKTKIAKFILGAANRMPDIAVSFFEGCAVMVVGVSANGIEGVPPIEMMELDKVVRPFLGAAGPHWDVVRVPVSGSSNQVLVVIVDPPMQGHGPFICRADGEELRNGRIYIRADGATREATADEVDLLIQRGSTEAIASVDFDVQVLGEVHPIVFDESATLEKYISDAKIRLIGALPRVEPEETELYSLQSALASIGSSFDFGTKPEDRTTQEYLDEIEMWEEQFRVAWPNAIERLAGRVLHAPKVLLVNKVSTFFHDIQLKVHLAGNVFGVEFFGLDVEDVSRYDLDLPSPPRIWGPRQNSTFIPYMYGSIPTPSMNVGYTPALPRLDWKNSNSIDLTLDVGDLRPIATEVFDEDQFVFFSRDTNIPPITGDWEITARGFNQVFTGPVSVKVGPCEDVTRLLQRILGISIEDDGEAVEE